jgi:hypothetical protein
MTGMPAWGSTHSDDALWPVVALMTALPELDSEAYEDLLGRAEGMGHHAGDAPDSGHAPGSHEHEPLENDRERADVEEPEEEEHDHSTHEH